MIRKSLALFGMLLLMGIGLPTTKAGNGIGFSFCADINGRTTSGVAQQGVYMQAGDSLTVHVTGNGTTFSIHDGKSISTSIPGTLTYKATAAETVIIQVNLTPGGAEMHYTCGKSSGGGSDDGESKAGPPCDNLFDGRINDSQALDCGAPIAIYLHSIDIYGIDPVSGDGTLVMSINADVLKGTKPESNTLLSEGTNILTGKTLQVYWLVASNEIEVITEYADAKPYIVVWPVDHPDRLYHLAA